MAPVDRITRFGVVNAFLVDEEDGLTVVDTTLAGGAKRISSAAKETGRPIARILLTHAHADHIGSLDALAKAQRLLPGRRCRARPAVGDGDTVGSLEVVSAPGHGKVIEDPVGRMRGAVAKAA